MTKGRTVSVRVGSVVLLELRRSEEPGAELEGGELLLTLDQVLLVRRALPLRER